jgi:chemotaxis methyl-accepting protein methylase
MAMLFHRAAAVRGMLGQIERVKVLGTDLDRVSLETATEGRYAPVALAEMPPDLRRRYVSDRPPYSPAAGIRRMVTFARNDLLSDAYPTGPHHVIICRNVLIYFDRAVQETVLHALRESLAPGGFLILGKVESLLGNTRQYFEPVAQRGRIFRRIS